MTAPCTYFMKSRVHGLPRPHRPRSWEAATCPTTRVKGDGSLPRGVSYCVRPAQRSATGCVPHKPGGPLPAPFVPPAVPPCPWTPDAAGRLRGLELLHFGTALPTWGTGLASRFHAATARRSSSGARHTHHPHVTCVQREPQSPTLLREARLEADGTKQQDNLPTSSTTPGVRAPTHAADPLSLLLAVHRWTVDLRHSCAGSRDAAPPPQRVAADPVVASPWHLDRGNANWRAPPAGIGLTR